MGVKVAFYQFSKRENSTKLPTASTPTSGIVYCNLKDSCGIINPIIEVNSTINSGNPTIYNYAAIEEFDRVYYIDNWTYENGIWIASMSVDVLGSNKLAIGTSTQYILRSASASDGNVMDTYYPTKHGTTITTNNITTNPYVSDLADGCYIVGIISPATGSDPTVGGVNYVGFDQTSMKSFMDNLFANVTYMGTITDVTPQMLRALVNPYQYIASCMWFPFDITTFSQGSTNLTNLGWWNISSTHYILTRGLLNSTITGQFTIPKHPQASTRGAYLNQGPYSKYMLDFKPFGFIPVDGADLAGYSTLYCKIVLDVVSGEAILTISPTNDFAKPLYITSTTIGVQIQLAQMTMDVMGAYQATSNTVFGTFANFLTGNFGGAASAASSGLASAVESSFPTVATSGSNGSLAAYQTTPSLTGTFYSIVDENLDHAGRPLCQQKVINTLSGYILCLDADIDLARTDTEIRMIKDYMESGFFYE